MKEAEIRPEQIFRKYLELSSKDGELLDKSKFVNVLCPGCHCNKTVEKFIKNGFRYVLCQKCNSLYCSPRPSEEQLHSLYSGSESSKYWSEVFFPAVAEKRREKLFRPKAFKILQYLKERGVHVTRVCDVGAGHGIFLEELRTLLPSVAYSAIEPDRNMAEICRKKGFSVLEKPLEEADEWHKRFDLVMSSEVIEHVFSPKAYIEGLFRLLDSGVCLVTGLGYEGLDILTLQERSSSVFPPHHLNFLSVRGFQELFKSSGFDGVDVVTPGLLDVDIVLGSGHASEFLKVLAARGPEAVEDMQKLLQKHKLSSHVWVVGQVRGINGNP